MATTALPPASAVTVLVSRRVKPGHEAAFVQAADAHQPPPSWKVALVTWLGICPTVYVLFLVVAPFLTDWSLLPRVMVITALVVLVMTWIVAPRLTTWLKPFLLTPSQKPGFNPLLSLELL